MGRLIFRHLGHSFRHLVDLSKELDGFCAAILVCLMGSASKYFRLGRLFPAA